MFRLVETRKLNTCQIGTKQNEQLTFWREKAENFLLCETRT